MSLLIFFFSKQDEFDKFLNGLLTLFGLRSLKARIVFLFTESKNKVQFKWGKRAQVFAAACIYVAAKEAKKTLWLLELAVRTPFPLSSSSTVLNYSSMQDQVEMKDLYTLTRAIRIVKLECRLPHDEDADPAMFIERILGHLNSLFSSPTPPPLHGAARKKAWSASNLTWVRSISLPEVRNLAADLLAFGHDISLTSGRNPAQVAGAVILVALEGAARRPAPVAQDFADELAFLLGGKAFTIQERYREFNKLLAEYAPQLPWLSNDEFALPGEKAKKGNKRSSKKKELVQYTSDIVQFRRAIEAKRTRDRKAAEHEATEKQKGKGREDEDEDEDDERLVVDENDDGEEEDDSVGDNYFEDAMIRDPSAPPVNGSRPPAKRARSSSLTASPAPATLSPELSSTTSAPSLIPRSGSARQQDMARMRPTRYSKQQDITSDKKLKRIHQVSEGLIASTSSSFRRASSTSLSPPPPAVPAPSASTSTATSNHSRTVPLAPHDPANVQIRQLLLAGHEPAAIHAHLHHPKSQSSSAIAPHPSSNRLSRLLWSKTADEITSDELFDSGELDFYIRSERDVEAFRRLPKTQAMIQDHAECELKAALTPKRQNPARPRRTRLFAKYYPELDKVENKAEEMRDGRTKEEREEAAARVAGAGPGWREDKELSKQRKQREGTAGSNSFKPRQKKTKVNAEAKARIAALLALADGSDDEEDGNGYLGGGAGGGTEKDEWRMDFALDAALEEGEEVASEAGDHRDDDDDDADDEDLPPRAGRNRRRNEPEEESEEDWRTAMGYGGRNDAADDNEYDE